MDFQPTPDQAALVAAVEQIVERHRDPPKTGSTALYDAALDAKLRDGGFAAIAAEDGMGGLEAALVTDVVCRVPGSVEIAASALVAPMVLGRAVPGPVALVVDPQRSTRFLVQAKTAFIRTANGAVLLDLHGVAREAVDTLFAYPFGRFTTPPDLARGTRLSAEEAARLDLWWRVAVAVEAAAAMRAAVDFTVDYVKQRRAFGRPIGSFQAIQHRLAERTVQAEAAKWLAREAAWKGDAASAALAATYAQHAIPAAVHDCHQFNGALGITHDHPLHYWTFRLLALQGELGGAGASAVAAAQALWPAAA